MVRRRPRDRRPPGRRRVRSRLRRGDRHLPHWCVADRVASIVSIAIVFQGASAVARSPTVPDEIEPGFVLEAALGQLSRQYIERALHQTHGHKQRASKLLGLKSHQVLSGRMKKLGIKVPP